MSKNKEVAHIINIHPFNQHSYVKVALFELLHNPHIDVPDHPSEMNSLVLGVFSEYLFNSLPKNEQINFINSKSKEAQRFKKYFANHFEQVSEATCNQLLESMLEIQTHDHRKNVTKKKS